MGFTDWIGISKAIPKTVEAVSNLYTTDKARIEAQTNLANVIQKSDNLEGQANVIDAQGKNLFQILWRPLIGWTAGACFALYYVPQLLVVNYVWGYDCITHHKIMPFPMKPDDILNCIYLMLGFGAYRLIEKKF